MNTTVESKIQLFGAWCAVLYIVAALLGWGLIARFLPPVAPSLNPEQVAALFQTDYTQIRIGMIFLMIAAFFYIPFTAALSQFLAQIEGRPGMLTYSTLLGGAGAMILTFYPAIWWLVAAYRPDRPIELIYLMNDMAWLQFIGGVTVFFAMPGSVILAAFIDKSETPVFPRWSGYLNILIILLIVPDQLIFFFHSGPFAWNGIFGLWVPFGVFGGWLVLTFYLMRKAILRERQNESQ